MLVTGNHCQQSEKSECRSSEDMTLFLHHERPGRWGEAFSSEVPFPKMKKPGLDCSCLFPDSSSVCSTSCGMRSLWWHRAKSFSLTAFPYCSTWPTPLSGLPLSLAISRGGFSSIPFVIVSQQWLLCLQLCHYQKWNLHTLLMLLRFYFAVYHTFVTLAPKMLKPSPYWYLV
jgi:hypothetical protein